jgi:hypothetical protein
MYLEQEIIILLISVYLNVCGNSSRIEKILGLLYEKEMFAVVF